MRSTFALFALALFACSSDDDPRDELRANETAQIKLQTGCAL